MTQGQEPQGGEQGGGGLLGDTRGWGDRRGTEALGTKLHPAHGVQGWPGQGLGDPRAGHPVPHGAQVHKAIPQQLKVRGVVGTESRNLAGMERDVNISDPRGARPEEDEEDGASGSPSSASGSSAASPACAAAGREQRGDNQGGGTSMGFPQPHHLPCTQIWAKHSRQVWIIKRCVLGRKLLISLKCFPSPPAGCNLLGLGAEHGDSGMLGGPCAHLLVLLPDELLRLRIRHRGDDRDGEICPTLPRQFAVGQREEMRLFPPTPPKPSSSPPNSQNISQTHTRAGANQRGQCWPPGVPQPPKTAGLCHSPCSQQLCAAFPEHHPGKALVVQRILPGATPSQRAGSMASPMARTQGGTSSGGRVPAGATRCPSR